MSTYGFQSWLAFNRAGEQSLVSALPSGPGAYVVRRCQDYKRRVGESDVVYVGFATNEQGLRMGIRQFFHPGRSQSTHKRILALVGDSSDYELAYVETQAAPDAKMLKARLLEHYERDHAELPPENKRH